PRGNYYLQVRAADYEPLREDVNISSGSPLGIQLSLRHRGEKVAANSPTVSARQLSIPRPAREAMDRGIALMHEKKDYKGSVAQFQKAVKEYPQYYEAYTQMGVAYMMMRDSDKAEDA